MFILLCTRACRGNTTQEDGSCNRRRRAALTPITACTMLLTMPGNDLTRRAAMQAFASFVAGSPLLCGQTDPRRYTDRVPGFAELATAYDFEAVAYARLPRAAYDYPASATDSGFTLRRNREAFDWAEFVPARVVDAGKSVDGVADRGTRAVSQRRRGGNAAGCGRGFADADDREQQFQLSH